MKDYIIKSLWLAFFLAFFVEYAFGSDKEGYFQGKHWEVKWNSNNKRYGLFVDNQQVMPYDFYDISPKKVDNDNMFFMVDNRPYDEVISEGVNGRSVYTFNGSLLIPNISHIHEFLSDDNLGGLIKVNIKDGKEWLTAIYTFQGKRLVPPVHSREIYLRKNFQNETYFEVEYYEYDSEIRHYVSIYDADGNNIIPLSKHYTAILHKTISGKTYYSFRKSGLWGICDGNGIQKLAPLYTDLIVTESPLIAFKKNGSWGLTSIDNNEILPPEYEGLSVFSGTNYVKFKLNGFCGVIQVQGNSTKTIIPTTRGYTDIGKYIKSQKRFTYTMNGYKGECNHLGQQISKIKVATSNPSTNVTSSSSSSSSSSSKSSSSSSSTSTATSSSSSNSNNSGNKTTTVVVEHHRDPVPVQQWQACWACGGMGTMGCDNCGGGGTKYIGDRLHRCSRCNGRGIIPCNICHGNKGQYITVYQ